MSAIERMTRDWGQDAPAWVRALAAECDRTSQAKVASLLSYSPAVVNQVLKRTYKGNYKAVEMAVAGAFMDATVNCPVLGELNTERCAHYQRQPYANSNAMRVRLFRACRGGCPHYRGKED